jgi:hypothetical protein
MRRFITHHTKLQFILSSRRSLEDEQFGGRILEMAERIFCNLQKVMTDDSISTAAGLEEGSSYHKI